jgi:hypothetical protein
VPGSREGGGAIKYSVNIFIEALSPHFYPLIYLKKVEEKSQPKELANMTYPTIVDYDLVFGENPFRQLQQKTFSYQFEGDSVEPWSYYTVALFE